jgi:hypothetical protein
MQTAAQLDTLLKKHRKLSQDIEWAKLRLAGGSAYPVDPRRWKAWKARQVRKTSARLTDNLHYKRLLRLTRQLEHVSFELFFGDSYDAEEGFLRDVAMSFPSLREVYDPNLSAWSVAVILCPEESADPQAYQAAIFVHALGCLIHGWKVDPPFFIDKAFEVWDNVHKEAFARWLGMPCFPEGEFRRLSYH